MLLKWNKDNLKVVSLVATTAEAKKVSLRRTQVQLLPGINEVSDDEYLVMKPHLKRNLENGSLVEIQEKTQTCPGKPQRDALSIVDLPAKKAARLIKDTTNPETLNLWLAKEVRPEIRQRVLDRIKELGLKDESVDTLLDEGDEELTKKAGRKKAADLEDTDTQE